jgi:hypothetical protein
VYYLRRKALPNLFLTLHLLSLILPSQQYLLQSNLNRFIPLALLIALPNPKTGELEDGLGGREAERARKPAYTKLLSIRELKYRCLTYIG